MGIFSSDGNIFPSLNVTYRYWLRISLVAAVHVETGGCKYGLAELEDFVGVRITPSGPFGFLFKQGFIDDHGR